MDDEPGQRPAERGSGHDERRAQPEDETIARVGLGVLASGNGQLQVDQLGDLRRQRIDVGIERSVERAQAPRLVRRRQRRQLRAKPGHRGVGRSEQLLRVGRQARLLGGQRRGHVGAPLLLDARLRPVDARERFRRRHHAGIGLVGGVDDEDGIVVGDHLQLLQRDHAIPVHRLQPAGGLADPHQADNADHQRQREQSADDEHETGLQVARGQGATPSSSTGCGGDANRDDPPESSVGSGRAEQMISKFAVVSRKPDS